MVRVPAGEFTMGSSKPDEEGLGKEFGLRTGKFFDSESPERRIHLDTFYIDTFEVTNADYLKFIKTSGYAVPRGWNEAKANHPVTGITWFAARAYCKWIEKRLPSEAEWEKAARGPDGNEYPWGMEFDKDKANFDSGDTAPVGSHKQDKSYYGAYDMGGNVMEWVEDWFKPYPGNTAEIKQYGEVLKVLRGGAGSSKGHYMIQKYYSRGAYRTNFKPNGTGGDAGFRCASSVGAGPTPKP
jgi:formylglycine-generating enzyme required for sulfatase activity